MVVSPCISICKTDPDTGYCYGCGRTDAEKIKWKSEEATEDWKKQNLKEIENRLSGWQLESFIKSYKCKVSTGVSTRTSVELAGLLFDGFTLDEAAEVTIYPQYSDDGGVDSERTFVKQLVQKYCDDGTEDDLSLIHI